MLCFAPVAHPEDRAMGGGRREYGGCAPSGGAGTEPPEAGVSMHFV